MRFIKGFFKIHAHRALLNYSLFIIHFSLYKSHYRVYRQAKTFPLLRENVFLVIVLVIILIVNETAAGNTTANLVYN